MIDVCPSTSTSCRPSATTSTTPASTGVAVVTLDRPETRNAQNKRMTYELNACFDDAARGTDVKVIVLQADGPHFSSGHDMRDREPHRRVRPRLDERRVLARRPGGPDGLRGGGLLPDVLAVAQPPQAGHRRGPGQDDRRRADAPVDRRHHHRRRRRRVLRPGRRHGRQRRRVLRPPVGARRPQGQGAAVHRRLRQRRGRPPARDGQPRRARRASCTTTRWRWPAASPAARASPSSWPRRASTRRSRRRVSGPRCARRSRSSTSPTPTTGRASASPSTRDRARLRASTDDVNLGGHQLGKRHVGRPEPRSRRGPRRRSVPDVPSNSRAPA